MNEPPPIDIRQGRDRTARWIIWCETHVEHASWEQREARNSAIVRDYFFLIVAMISCGVIGYAIWHELRIPFWDETYVAGVTALLTLFVLKYVLDFPGLTHERTWPLPGCPRWYFSTNVASAAVITSLSSGRQIRFETAAMRLTGKFHFDRIEVDAPRVKGFILTTLPEFAGVQVSSGAPPMHCILADMGGGDVTPVATHSGHKRDMVYLHGQLNSLLLGDRSEPGNPPRTNDGDDPI